METHSRRRLRDQEPLTFESSLCVGRALLIGRRLCMRLNAKPMARAYNELMLG
jgi:hypothetical protein